MAERNVGRPVELVGRHADGSGHLDFTFEDGTVLSTTCAVLSAPPEPEPEPTVDEAPTETGALTEAEEPSDGSETASNSGDAELAIEAAAHATEDKAQLKGALPPDFPGHAALEGAGVTTYAQARKAFRKETGWTHIDGIGPATNTALAEALGMSLSE